MLDRILPNPAVHAASIPAQAGIGLRFPHHQHVLGNPGSAAWLEVHPENYLGEGVAAEILEQVRARYPVSLHATGLSLGSADGVDASHLAAIADLCRRIEPGLVSDHLSWSAADGKHLPDLLPLPYTREAQDIFARNIETVQAALGRTLLIENPSVYLAFAGNEMSEGEFLAGLVRRTGCGVLLDINNVVVSAANLARRLTRGWRPCWMSCLNPPSAKSTWLVTLCTRCRVAGKCASTTTDRRSAKRCGGCSRTPCTASVRVRR